MQPSSLASSTIRSNFSSFSVLGYVSSCSSLLLCGRRQMTIISERQEQAANYLLTCTHLRKICDCHPLLRADLEYPNRFTDQQLSNYRQGYGRRDHLRRYKPRSYSRLPSVSSKVRVQQYRRSAHAYHGLYNLDRIDQRSLCARRIVYVHILARRLCLSSDFLCAAETCVSLLLLVS